MKKVIFLSLMIVAGFATIISTTGCSGTGTPTPQDTTDNTQPTIVNGFNLGLDKFEVTTNDNQSFAAFGTSQNKTFITIVGKDTKQPTDEQEVTLYIDIDSNAVGTYTQANGKATLQLGVGTGIKHQDFASTSLTVTITQYDAVGGRIKGTFSGSAKATNQTSTTGITNGYFDVVRNADQ